MSDRYFLDTNIIVYAYDDRDTEKQAVAKKLIVDGVQNELASISHQVVQEFINVSTKKFEPSLSSSDCKLFIDRSLIYLWDVNPTKELFYSALDISERWQYSFMIH